MIPKNWATPPRWYIQAIDDAWGEPYARPVEPAKPVPRYVPYVGDQIAG